MRWAIAAILLSQALAWVPSPAPLVPTRRCPSLAVQPTMQLQGKAIVDRRGLGFLMVGAAALFGRVPESNAATGKSSNELQKDVAALEREVEQSFKTASASSEQGIKTFSAAFQNGNLSSILFKDFANRSNSAAAIASNLQNESTTVFNKFVEDEERLGEEAVTKYEAAQALGKKGGEKVSQLLAEGSELKKKVQVKIKQQKEWGNQVEKIAQSSKALKTLADAETKTSLGLLASSMKNASVAIEMFKLGSKNMGSVRLFNDAGTEVNASKPLKMVRDALAIMKGAEAEASKAATNLKKLSDKAQGYKTTATTAGDRANELLKEVANAGKKSEKILKESSQNLAIASQKVGECEQRASAFASGIKSAMQYMKDAEAKYAAAEKAGIKSDQIYSEVQLVAQKEQEELERYRKQRKATTTKLAPAAPNATTAAAPAAPAGASTAAAPKPAAPPAAAPKPPAPPAPQAPPTPAAAAPAASSTSVPPPPPPPLRPSAPPPAASTVTSAPAASVKPPPPPPPPPAPAAAKAAPKDEDDD